MKLIISNNLSLRDVPADLEREIRDRLTFKNPAYLEAVKMNRWIGKLEEHLRFYRERDGTLTIPRGFIRQAISMARRLGVPFQLEDRRRTLPEVPFTFNGTLKAFQDEAVNVILQRDFGTLSAPTGSGKTVMGLCVIANRKQPTLVVVHTKELLHQWQARIETFLGIPSKEIGVIGDGRRTLGDKITVALVQSLYKCVDEVSPHIGHLVVDECHRTPSRTFTEAVTAFDSRYMLGLSATPWRRDGLSKLIHWHLGDVVHEIKSESLQESGDILRVKVTWRETDFQTSLDPSEEYSRMLSELTEDPARNALIASDVARETQNSDGVCLVLTDRKSHCAAFRCLLQDLGVKAEVLTGDVKNGDRQDIVDRLNAGQVKVLVATGQLIGEGFDCKRLSTLFLATPIRFDGRVIQYIGRVLRPAPGKGRARVFDYVDVFVGPLKAAAKARLRIYTRGVPLNP